MKLLSSAAHPLMDPLTETKLWEHCDSEIYDLYNKIFDCRGHGWSNVQSMHINLPFYDDDEFEKLHAAIRVILPLLPGLAASTPILEGKSTGIKDNRLAFYKTNQKEIPEITGKVIPEQVFSKKAYYEKIFDPIKIAIAPFDEDKILDHHFLNSRGAIARFDRNAIEIRLLDIQECPKADIAICALVIEVLKLLVSQRLSSLEAQKGFSEDDLLPILNIGIKEGETAKVERLDYLELFKIETASTMQEVWQHLYQLVKHTISKDHQEALEVILKEGTLATRLLKAVGNDFSEKQLVSVYQQLADCLQENKVLTVETSIEL